MKRSTFHYCNTFIFDVVKVLAARRPSGQAGLPSGNRVDMGLLITPICVDCGRRRPSVSRTAA